MAERGLLEALHGTCHSPVAVLATDCSGEVAIKAAIFSPDGADRVDAEGVVAAGDKAALLAMGADLLARATPAIRAAFGGADA